MPTPAELGYRYALLKHAQEWADEVVSGRRDKGLTAMDLVPAIPYAGGGIHGLLDPAEGTNRLESGAVQGMLGAGAGLIGTGLGGLVGGLAGRGIAGDNNPNSDWPAALAMLGALTGAVGGTYGGSAIGRALVRRDTTTPEDLRNAMIAQLRAQAAAQPEKAAQASVNYGKLPPPPSLLDNPLASAREGLWSELATAAAKPPAWTRQAAKRIADRRSKPKPKA